MVTLEFKTTLIVFRSPWSNTYFPPLDDGAVPTEKLRKLEIDANMAFDQYREMYFEGGVSSVYLWDLDQGFAGNTHLFYLPNIRLLTYFFVPRMFQVLKT